MIYKLIYLIIQKFSQKNKSVAIRIDGEAENLKVEDNISGMPLLDAKNIKNSSIKSNLIYMPNPKNIHWVWKILIDLFVILIILFFIHKLGLDKNITLML